MCPAQAGHLAVSNPQAEDGASRLGGSGTAPDQATLGATVALVVSARLRFFSPAAELRKGGTLTQRMLRQY